MTIESQQLRIVNKLPCRVTTLGPVTLVGGAPNTVDGIALAADDRVLVRLQAAGAENGIYKVDTLGTGANGTWIRTEDFDHVTLDQIEAGLFAYIQEGTQEKKTYHLTTTGTIVLGVTSLTFEELGGGGGGGVGGSTGATDNALLRADGVGGSTLQSSDVVLDDNENFTGIASLGLDQQAAAPTVATDDGAFWVRDDSLPSPIFTEGDSNTDYHLLNYSPTKRPCVVATLGDISLAGGAPDTVDGISLSANDRVLAWEQSTASEVGIYRVQTVGTGADGTWVRAEDFDDATKDHIEAGIETYIQRGDTYGRARFTLVTEGAITIGVTDLEFIPEGGLARTDGSSTEIIASTAFTNGTFIVNDSGFTNMRDYTEIVVYFIPTDVGTNTQVDIVVFWSDDGTTIPFGLDDNIQQSDFDITNQSDGSFFPQPYTARLTTAGGELATNKGIHLTFPKAGGVCKVGVKGDANDGAFSVRVQRVVR